MQKLHRLTGWILFLGMGTGYVFPLVSYCQPWKKQLDSARYFLENDKPEKGKYLIESAQKNIPKDSLQRESIFRFCNQAASLYYEFGYSEDAISWYLKSIEAITVCCGEIHSEFAGQADTLGQLYMSFDPARAEYFFRKAKDIRLKLFGPESAAYAGSCNNLANFYNRAGKAEEAEKLYRESMDIRLRLYGSEDSSYAQSCNNLADLLRKKGRFEEAEPLAAKAKSIRQKMSPAGHHPKYAISCVNLANLKRDLGQYPEAEQLYLEAREIRAGFRPERQSIDYIESCNILAGFYYQEGENEKARSLYLELKRIFENKYGTDRKEYAQILNNLALVYLDSQVPDSAEQLALQARKIWGKTLAPADPNRAVNNNLLGRVYQQTGKYQKALSYYLQAASQWKKQTGTDHPYYIQVTGSLAEIYQSLGETAKSEKLYVEMYRNQFRQIRKIFRFTSEQEKENYLNNIVNAGDEYFSFFQSHMKMTRAGIPYDISLMNRNLILESSRDIRRFINASGDTAIISRYERWQALKRLLSIYYSRNDPSQALQVKSLESTAAELEKDLSRAFSASGIKPAEPARWTDIRNKLHPGEASIEFIEYRFFNGTRWTDSIYYGALLLRKEYEEPRMIVLFEKNRLDSLTQNISNSPEKIETYYGRGGRVGQMIRMGPALYGMVWKPLDKYLNGVKKIYFAPTGALYKIAFAALPDNKGKLLCEKYRLEQLFTTGSSGTFTNTRIKERDTLCMYGAIDYDAYHKEGNLSPKNGSGHPQEWRIHPFLSDSTGGFSGLPGTKREIDAISSLAREHHLLTRVWSGREATEESFRKLSNNPSVTIIHLATHGFYFPPGKKEGFPGGINYRINQDPLMRSGIAMAGANKAWNGSGLPDSVDGILSGYEVAGLNFPRAKLVVLSACETGLGDIQGSEGVYGLQRAFKLAGVPWLLMSLWQVPDYETAEFMTEFYRNLFDQNSIERAFSDARDALHKKYPDQPYKWASWVLVH